jgi:cytochrome c
MPFRGITDAAARADLIAFLKEAGAGNSSGAASDQGSGMGSMMAEMDSQFQDLKKLGPEHQVQAIRYCHDTYHVTTADGQTTDFWEVNLRLKTDSRETGPLPGKPVLLGAGMGGDRSSVFFAAPEEISPFIKHQC